MKLIIFGPPGSGKGTVAARLSKDYNLLHLSAGELLRQEAKTNKTIAKTIEKGDLVPSQLVVNLIKKKIGKRSNYILDGFPRSLDQAEAIEDLQIDQVIYLDVPEKVIVERLSGRRICEKGHTYHIKYIPPKKKGICDHDGTKLRQRKDDQPQVIRDRFRVYHQNTEPLTKYYKNILKKVDGAPLPNKVYENVLLTLK